MFSTAPTKKMRFGGHFDRKKRKKAGSPAHDPAFSPVSDDGLTGSQKQVKFRTPCHSWLCRSTFLRERVASWIGTWVKLPSQ